MNGGSGDIVVHEAKTAFVSNNYKNNNLSCLSKGIKVYPFIIHNNEIIVIFITLLVGNNVIVEDGSYITYSIHVSPDGDYPVTLLAHSCSEV